MLIIPAIDLKGGKCVRLRQGRADESTVYGDNPVAMAQHWASEGAGYLHVVDLDGAFEGRPVHLAVVREIVRAVRMPVELGGGLRTDEDVARAVDAGVARAIIGTRALADDATLQALVARFGERLAVGIDARGGRVQIKGWVETTATRAVDLAQRAATLGVRTLIYTDTATDGMLGGPNVAGVGELCRAVPCDVVASGGVCSAEHVKALAALRCSNLKGAIVGKALYERTTTLRELTRAGGDGVG